MITNEKCIVEFLDKFHQYVKDGRILKDECVRVFDPTEEVADKFRECDKISL